MTIAPVAASDHPSTPFPETAARVTVQLKWLHQFQFAGFYAAIDQGYYRAADIDVTLLEGDPNRSATDAVMSGEAQFGIGNSSLVIDRAKGHDVVVLAPIFQHSPFVMIAKRAPHLNDIRDLAGERVMVEADAAENLAYMRRAGLPEGAIVEVPHTGDPLALRDADIVAATAYSTTEPYSLIQHRVPFQLFSPRELGINFYGDTLFTTGELARQNPELVRAFRDATLEGWRYALKNTDRVIDVILERYAPDADRLQLEFEAEEIKRLMIANIVDPGYGNVDRWAHIADVFASVGMLDPAFDLDGFLFDVEPQADLRWVLVVMTLAGAAILVLGRTCQRFYRMNRELTAEVAHRRALEARLLGLATTDDLTGLPNRRHFFEFGNAAFRRARAERRILSLLVLDIDRFKQVNDAWGHEVGDLVLRSVGTSLQPLMEEAGEVARLGGEEFALVLPYADAHAAAKWAEQVRATLAAIEVRRREAPVIRITASVGAATMNPADRSFEDIVSRADKAMYEAKAAGRNRIVTAGLAA